MISSRWTRDLDENSMDALRQPQGSQEQATVNTHEMMRAGGSTEQGGEILRSPRLLGWVSGRRGGD